MRESARTGTFRGEGVIRRADGIEVPAEISCVVVADESGASRASIVIREIAGRKQAEKTIQQGEELLEAFFAASPGILNIEDEELRYIRTDRVTPTYFGLDRQGIVGKSVADLAPEFVREYGPMMRRVMIPASRSQPRSAGRGSGHGRHGALASILFSDSTAPGAAGPRGDWDGYHRPEDGGTESSPE